MGQSETQHYENHGYKQVSEGSDTETIIHHFNDFYDKEQIVINPQSLLQQQQPQPYQPKL